MPAEATDDAIPEHKIVLFGAGSVGKSAFIFQYMENVFVESYDPTLEDSYRKETQIDGKSVILDIMDTAGQEELFSLRDQYIRTSDGFIIVYSIENKQTFGVVGDFITRILRTRNTDPQPGLPIILVGNKCDLEENREISKTEGEEIANKFGIPFYEASAKTRYNIEEIFIAISRLISKWDWAELGDAEEKKPKDHRTERKSKCCVIL